MYAGRFLCGVLALSAVESCQSSEPSQAPTPSATSTRSERLPRADWAVLGPVPDECQPHRQSTPAWHIRDLPTIPGEPHSERRDCWKSSKSISCDFWSVENAFDYASRHLFPFTPEGDRAPYGGGADCQEPLTADTVHCTVGIRDTKAPLLNRTIEEVDIDCTSVRRCKQTEDCCKVVRRRKVDKTEPSPTPEEMQQLYAEMANNRAKRFETCRPWCENPKFTPECADSWDVGRVDYDRKQKGLSPRPPNSL